MIRFVFRLAGLVFLAAGAVFLFNDLAASGSLEALRLTSFGGFWYAQSPETLNLSQAVIQRHVAPFLWDPVLQTVLTWPLAAVVAGLGALFLVLTARRRREPFAA